MSNNQNQQYTEIERAALTMLAQHLDEVYSPEIQKYVSAVLDASTSDILARGHHPNDISYSRKEVDAFDYNKISDKYERNLAWSSDAAMADLASAIVIYRRDGKPTGDQITQLDRLSHLSITSSLAANVVEFHIAILNATARFGFD